MQGKWIASSILLVWLIVDFATAAEKPKKGAGCVYPLPDTFMNACKKCKVTLPATFERPASAKKGKRAAKTKEKTTTTPKPPPKASITATDRKNARCIMKELNVTDSTGVSFTETRRYGDKNYPGSPDMKIWHRIVKQVAEDSSNCKRDKETATDMFIDGIINEYKKFCGK